MSLHDPGYDATVFAYRAKVAKAKIAALRAEAKQAKSRADAAVRTAQKAMQERDALRAECEALRADMDWLEKRKQREVRDGGYSAFFVIHLPAMASGPWQRKHGGEFDCNTLREAIDNERSKA